MSSDRGLKQTHLVLLLLIRRFARVGWFVVSQDMERFGEGLPEPDRPADGEQYRQQADGDGEDDADFPIGDGEQHHLFLLRVGEELLDSGFDLFRTGG